MNFLNESHLSEVLHAISQALIIPVIILLVLLAVYAVYTLGSLVVEFIVERKHYKVVLPHLIADLNEAKYDQMPDLISKSGLLDTQKAALRELVHYLYLPKDALSEVARRLLADESERYQRALSPTESAVKIAPMLGLMGTLIPLGPGIIALSSGDLTTLSDSLLVAFDTTVAGLAVAVVCFLVSKLRRRWYSSYLISLEGAMNAILEKADFLRDEGVFCASSDAASKASSKEVIADGEA